MTLCSIEGCEKALRARGWCANHWAHWRRHGDPLGGRQYAEAQRYFQDVVRPYDGVECLFWPFGADSRGAKLWREDQMHSVARLLCEEERGPAPTPDHEAAHSCGNGKLACVAKRHLSWKTHAANMADMPIHGTSTRGERNPVAKLTEAEVVAIRSLSGSMFQREIADQFGVSKQQIGKILRGERWGWLNV